MKHISWVVATLTRHFFLVIFGSLAILVFIDGIREVAGADSAISTASSSGGSHFVSIEKRRVRFGDAVVVNFDLGKNPFGYVTLLNADGSYTSDLPWAYTDGQTPGTVTLIPTRRGRHYVAGYRFYREPISAASIELSVE